MEDQNSSRALPFFSKVYFLFSIFFIVHIIMLDHVSQFYLNTDPPVWLDIFVSCMCVYM